MQVRVAGAITGSVLVDDDLAATTLQAFRAEVARLHGLPSAAGVKLILGGRTLLDDSKSLQELGFSVSSRVLVVAGAQAGSQLQQQEAKQDRLNKIQRALGKMSARHSARHDNYSFDIVNQDGKPMQLLEEDRKAVGMGMALCDMGKAAMAKGNFDEAFQLLSIGEESLTMADTSLLKSIDNLGMLLLDLVWCCYKSGDIQRLAVARNRLARARQALQDAYGADLQRLRQLHGSRCPEHSIFTRLEALEAVAAFHGGDMDRCRAALQAAQGHWNALQVSDVSLAQLQDMGFSLQESRRALRLSSGNMDMAVAHIAKERDAAQAMKEKRARDAQWREERRQYGRLASGDYIDGDLVQRLESLAFGRELAALSLRLHGNDLNAALEQLLGERPNAMLVQLHSVMQGVVQEAAQAHAAASSSAAAASSSATTAAQTLRRPRRALQPERLLSASAAAELAKVLAELSGTQAADGASAYASAASAAPLASEEEVLQRLHTTVRVLCVPRKRKAAAAAGGTAAGSGGGSGSGAESNQMGQPKRRATPSASGNESDLWVLVGRPNNSTANDAAMAAQLDVDIAAEATAALQVHEASPSLDSSEDEEAGGVGEGAEDIDAASDAEMEGEVRAALQSDALASYDLDVAEEGELIATYSALVASAQQQQGR